MKLEHYAHVATKLSFQYPFYGSGADEQDVYQVAMITAWMAVRDEPMIEPRFVHRRMKLRVLDFVRERKNGQSKFERQSMSILEDRVGADSTWERVRLRDEVGRLVEAVQRLPKRKRFYLAAHLNGIPHNEIAPDRKLQTVDAMLTRTRRHLERGVGIK